MIGVGIDLTSAVRRPLSAGTALPVISLSTTSVSHAEGNSGSTAYAYTVARSGDLSGASSATWTVTGSSGSPADAADFVGGVIPTGTVSFAAGASTATITVNVAGDSTVEPDEGFTVTLSSPVNATLGTASATGTITNDDAAPTVSSEIWGGEGDSLGVGIDAANRAVDTYGTNVWQVRMRAPTGLSNVSVSPPLDQAIAPDGIDHLSPYESFANQRATDIGAPVYLVPHNYNGTSISPSGGTNTWGVGNDLHEAFIARMNAAIQTTQAAVPGAVLGGLSCFIGSNDRSEGDAATFKSQLIAAIADQRARIFKNGISGADASDLPFIIYGIVPEAMQAAGYINYDLALREIAATVPNCKFYKMPEGIARADNLHPTLAGNRIIGPAAAALLTSTTAPTITVPATYTQFEGQNMLIELTSDVYAWWTLPAGETNYEIVSISDNTSGIGLTRSRQYLRWVGDGTKTPGSYSTTLTATGANGKKSSITRTDTVLAAYGTQVGTVAATNQTLFTGTITKDMRGRPNIPVSLGAGLNVIGLQMNNGTATDITSVTFNGIKATKEPNSSGMTQLWYLPSAVAQSGTLVITGNSTINAMACAIASVPGTVATPASSAVLPNGARTTPHLSPALTCPAGGIIVGGGAIAGLGTPTAGETELARSGTVFTADRMTDGSLGASGTNNGYSWIVAAAFAKAA